MAYTYNVMFEVSHLVVIKLFAIKKDLICGFWVCMFFFPTLLHHIFTHQ